MCRTRSGGGCFELDLLHHGTIAILVTTSRVGHITPKFGRMLRALLEFQKNILEMISRCSVCAKCKNAGNDDKQLVVIKFQRRFLHFLSPCMRALSCVSASAATLTMLAPSLKDTGQTRPEEHPRKCGRFTKLWRIVFAQ